MTVLLNEYKKIQFLVDSLVLPFIKNQHPKWRELILTFLEFLDENALNKSINISDNNASSTMYSELLDEFLNFYFKDVVDIEKFGLNSDNKRLFISLSKLIGNLKSTKTSFGFFFNSFSDFSIPTDSGDININDMAIELKEMPEWWLMNNDPTRPYTYVFKTDTPDLSNLKELIGRVHPAGWLQLFLFEISFDDESGQGEYMNGYDCFELDITSGVYYSGKFDYDGNMLVEGIQMPMYYDGGYTFADDLNCAPTPRHFGSSASIIFDLSSHIIPGMMRDFSSTASITFDIPSDVEITHDGYEIASTPSIQWDITDPVIDFTIGAACPAPVTFEYDEASNPETIGENDSVTVYVLGGVGPFTWAVSGSGFSFNLPETTIRENTLITSSGCGPGDITVTDFCGTEVTGIVRCVIGSWKLCASAFEQVPCTPAGCNSSMSPYWESYEIFASHRIRVIICCDHPVYAGCADNFTWKCDWGAYADGWQKTLNADVFAEDKGLDAADCVIHDGYKFSYDLLGAQYLQTWVWAC